MKSPLLLLILASFFCSSLAWAANSHSHSKSLAAHEHGILKLEMAMEEKTLEIDLDGPAQSFLGFESTPHTAKEKKLYLEAETLWKQNLFKLFTMDESLGCKILETTFKQEKEAGSHSDIEATAKIVCTKNLQGQKLKISLMKHFPHMKKISLALLGTSTKSLELKRAEEFIDL